MITETNGVFKTSELPELEHGQGRYIMAANGLYYEQRDDLFHASTQIHHFYRPVNFGSMSLLEHGEFFIPEFPPLPDNIIAQCLGFFQAVEDKTDCECGLVLLYDPVKRKYSWCCPEQEIGTVDLHFTTPIPGKDYPEHLVHFGDVHLHPGMSAYHSSTDYSDEMLASDGLHLVVGTPKSYGQWSYEEQKWIEGGRKPREYAAVFVSDGARFTIKPGLILNTKTEPGMFPPSWLKKCKQQRKKTVGFSQPSSSHGSKQSLVEWERNEDRRWSQYE